MKFQVGDRVRVFVCLKGQPLESDGVVHQWDALNDRRIRIMLDDVRTTAGKLIWAHPKQCRRLVKKKKPFTPVPEKIDLSHATGYYEMKFGERINWLLDREREHELLGSF